MRDKTKSTLYDTSQNGISFFQYDLTKAKGTEFKENRNENIKRLFYNQNAQQITDI